MKKILLTSLLLVGLAQAQPTLTFATEATYPPYESVSSSGQLQGFDIDVANAICSQLQVKCVFINQPFDSLLPSLQAGQFDAIIAAMAITKERQKVVDFTDPYYQDSVTFVAPTSVNFDPKAKSIGDLTIGVQKGTTFQNYLQTRYAGSLTVKTYASAEMAFMDLKAGRIDAVMGDTPLIKAWLSKQASSDYHLVGQPITDDAFFGAGDGIAVKKGRLDLLNSLNKAIQTLKSNGQLNQLSAHYFEQGS